MWVKLTNIYDNSIIYVNLDRYDRILRVVGDDDVEATSIVAALSETEDDYSAVRVKETPEEIMRLAGVFVPSP